MLPGSGDNKEEITFKLLSDPAGKECWLLNDGGKWYLYQAPPDLSQPYRVETTYETFAADTVRRNKVDQPPCLFSWVGFSQPYQHAEAPFRDATRGMLMEGNDRDDMMLAVPLLQTSSGVYYSARFPAAKMKRETVTPHTGLEGGPFVSHLGLGLAVLFGGATVLETTVLMKLCWWLGPLAVFLRCFSTRQSTWDHVLRLVGGLFLLHFATHGLDNFVTRDWEEQATPLFEMAKIAALSGALWGLRMWNLRVYYAVIDGVAYGGGCSWLVFVTGTIFLSLVDEANHFRWFTWYSGELPWAVFWPLAVAWCIWSTYKDYRKAPLDLAGFRSLVFRTVEVLDQKLDHCRLRSAQLTEWADDLEDALAISADPLVCSLVDYGEAFKLWQTQAAVLKDVVPDRVSDREQLEADLAAIAADFRELLSCLDRWPESWEGFKSLRCSPMLGTWNC